MKTGQPDVIIIIPHPAKTIFYENPFYCRISGKKLFLQRKNLHLFGRLICSILTTNIPPILVLTGCL